MIDHATRALKQICFYGSREEGLLNQLQKSVLALLGLVSRPSVPGWNNDLLTTVWKLRKFTFTLFWQKFRESNVFTKGVIKRVDFTKHFFGEVEFLVFPQCALIIIIFSQKFREIDTFLKNVAFTKFLSKICESKFP